MNIVKKDWTKGAYNNSYQVIKIMPIVSKEVKMADKNDYMKVASAQMLRINSKQEKPKQAFYFQSKHKQGLENGTDEFEMPEYQANLNYLDPHQLIELGRLLLNKRNTELKLFLRIKKRNNEDSKEFYNLLDTDILLIRGKLAEIEKKLSDFDFMHDDPVNLDEEDEVLEKMQSLHQLYSTFLESAKKENDILLNNEVDKLDTILNEKEEALVQIELNQKNINYDIFKNYSQDYSKKIKANEILVDIHNVMDEIVKIEDQNSVGLKNAMDEMKAKILTQNKNTQAISKYASGNVKSHFINTTK